MLDSVLAFQKNFDTIQSFLMQDSAPDGERPAAAALTVSNASGCTGNQIWLALHETQAAELAHRNEVQASQRREDEVLQELRSVVQSQAELSKLLHKERELLLIEREQTAILRAELQRAKIREQEQLEIHASMKDQLQQSTIKAQELVCQLKYKEKEVRVFECSPLKLARCVRLSW